MKMLVFSPHPDDETLGCGGTIVKKLGECVDVYVVVMTDGRHSHDHTLGITDPTPQEIRSIRRREFYDAMKVLGVDERNLLWLDFEDGTLGNHIEEAQAKVAAILAQIRPAEIYVPFRNDSHEDHKCTFRIVVQSLGKTGLSAKVYQYPIWSRKKDTSEYNTEDVILQDITNELETKTKAINVYKSQISKISLKQRSPVLEASVTDLFLQNIEVFYTSEFA